MEIKVGMKFKEKQGYKCHILAIIEDTENPGLFSKQIVYKYYGKRKQWWHYDIVGFYSFNMRLESGLYEIVK
jgi:hypothetical protein